MSGPARLGFKALRMIVLGVTHPISWNTGACLVKDGELVFVVEEERLNRFKFSSRVPPLLSIEACLKAGGIGMDDVDFFAVGWEAGNKQKRKKRFPWNYLARLLPFDIEDSRVRFVRHHLAHAIASYFLSGFGKAGVISLDAYGGSESGVLGIGDGADFKILKSVPTKASWGWIYSEVTTALGFRFHSDEGKVMGLASYGEPDLEGADFVDWDRDVPLIDRNRFRAYLSRIKGRSKSAPITGEHRNAAATIQAVLERGALQMAEYLSGAGGGRKLCVSGGCALNCSMNGALLRSGFADELYVNPAPHDLSTAIGAALWVYREEAGNWPSGRLTNAFLGPGFADAEVEAALRTAGAGRYRRMDDVCGEAAQRLAAGEVVGWFQGRSEFGPRALGGRSILADARDDQMRRRVNDLKGREEWRPLAPSIMAEEAGGMIDGPADSPFMQMALMASERAREAIPAAVHVDGTMRAQTVAHGDNPRFHDLLARFRDMTGVGALINTSFNLSRQPIVMTPRDALATFFASPMDSMAMGDFMVSKD